MKPASPQDWDAIFADFGNPSNATSPAPTSEQQGKLADNAGRQQQQTSSDQAEGGGVSLSGDEAGPAGASEGQAAVGNNQQQDGGVKVGGVEEEKIAKLREMGFDRENSVKALEKSGWNIDRVSR
jgi:hypothetical protein